MSVNYQALTTKLVEDSYLTAFAGLPLTEVLDFPNASAYASAQGGAPKFRLYMASITCNFFLDFTGYQTCRANFINSATSSNFTSKINSLSQVITFPQDCQNLAGGDIRVQLALDEYIYMWSINLCTNIINDDRQIDYSFIPIFKSIVTQPQEDASKTIDLILTELDSHSSLIDSRPMTTTCNSTFTVNDLVIHPPIKDLCGCYMNVSPQTYSGNEIAFLNNSPACKPSCLSARIRYIVDGKDTPCNQSLCIVDNVNIVGLPPGNIQVSQACNNCQRPGECLCYIHINGTTVNTPCNSVYKVIPSSTPGGAATAVLVSTNQPQGSSLGAILSSLPTNDIIYIAVGCIVGLALVLMITILVRYYIHKRRLRGKGK